MDLKQLLNDLIDAESVNASDVFTRAIDAVNQLQEWEQAFDVIQQRGILRGVEDGPAQWHDDHVAGVLFTMGILAGESHKLKVEKEGLEWQIKRHEHKLRAERWLTERFVESVVPSWNKFRVEHFKDAAAATGIGTTEESKPVTSGQPHLPAEVSITSTKAQTGQKD